MLYYNVFLIYSNLKILNLKFWKGFRGERGNHTFINEMSFLFQGETFPLSVLERYFVDLQTFPSKNILCFDLIYIQPVWIEKQGGNSIIIKKGFSVRIIHSDGNFLKVHNILHFSVEVCKRHGTYILDGNSEIGAHV